MSTLGPAFDLALRYHQAGDLLLAEQLYRQILQGDPNHVDALHLLGLVVVRSGRLAEGCEYLQRSVQLNPDFAEAHSNLGRTLRQLGRLEEAAASLEEAVRLKPNFADAHSNLGNVRREQGQFRQALAYYHEALRLKPDFADAHCNLGVTLRDMGQRGDAITHLHHALRLSPTLAAAHCTLGSILWDQGDHDAAMTHLREAIRLAPRHADAHAELGRILIEQDRWDEALASLGEALRLRPDHPEARNNLAVVWSKHGKLAEAIAAFREGLRLKPTDAWMHYNLGTSLLLCGDLEAGWPEHEWRWKTREFGSRTFTQPLWDGRPLEGQTILLHAEQGFGDTLQFIRYVPLVKERGGRVVVECQAPLVPLLSRCPGIDILVAAGTPLPPVDVQAPLLSLPSIFKTTLATVPATVPYLFASPALIQKWRRRLEVSTAFKVGIAWQGSSAHKWNRHRSAPLAEFALLARAPRVKLFSLQVGPGSDQLTALAGQFTVTDLGRPFDDTAAIIQNLDLVVTVDTAIAHLTGGLGVPLWVVLDTCPDWRWLLDREDSPWYPSARLFRQTKAGDWGEVFGRLANELRAPK